MLLFVEIAWPVEPEKKLNTTKFRNVIQLLMMIIITVDHLMMIKTADYFPIEKAQRRETPPAPPPLPSTHIVPRIESDSRDVSRYLPISQFAPVNPAGHKHWKVFGDKERQVALLGHGLDEQRFCVEKKRIIHV